jgi:hypothetical protein
LAPQKFVKLVRGLWTGWRSTTFINTTNNVHYSHVVRRSFKRRYGFDPIQQQQVLGDDMAGVARSEWCALQYLHWLNLHGLEAQSAKQLISGNRTEFLRLIYTDGREIRGSLARAVSGLVSGDGQTEPVHSGPQTCYGLNDSIHRLIRRGADRQCVEKWRYDALLPWAKISYFEGNKRHAVVFNRNMLECHPMHGGCGCRPYGAVPLMDTEPHNLRMPQSRLRWITDQFRHTGSNLAAHFGGDRLRELGVHVKEKQLQSAHALQLVVGALPASLASREWARTKKYYAALSEHFAQTTLEEVPMDGEIAQQWGTILETVMYMVEARQTAHKPPMDDVAAVQALTQPELQVIPGAAQLIPGKGYEYVHNVLKIGPAAVAPAVGRLVAAFGIKMASRLIRGEVDLPAPLTGLIPSSHRALVDECLWVATKQTTLGTRLLAGSEIAKVWLTATTTVERLLAAAPAINQQFAY